MGKKKDVHVTSMYFYCEWLDRYTRVPVHDIYVYAECDCCGRYQDRVLGEFDCKCGRRHTVQLQYPFDRP